MPATSRVTVALRWALYLSMLIDTPRVDHNLLDDSELSQADGEHQPHAFLPPEAIVQILTHSRGLLTDLH